MIDEFLIKEEENIKMLRYMVDITQAILMQSELTLTEAYRLLESTKESVLALFPDKEGVYDIIYTPRFRRIIAEKFSGEIMWH